MMQMNAGGHPLSIAAIKWTILQQGVREPTGVAIPARGTRAIPGVVEANDAAAAPVAPALQDGWMRVLAGYSCLRA